MTVASWCTLDLWVSPCGTVSGLFEVGLNPIFLSILETFTFPTPESNTFGGSGDVIMSFRWWTVIASDLHWGVLKMILGWWGMKG